MKMNDSCLTCIVNQAVRIAAMTGMQEKERLYSHVFRYLSETDYDRTAPEVTGDLFRIICEETGTDDPYLEVKSFYNRLMLSRYPQFSGEVKTLEDAVKYAIAGNIIDVSPAHENVDEAIRRCFASVLETPLTVNDVPRLERDLEKAENVLIVCDNCGEIVLDRLLAEKIKQLYPRVSVTFAVRGRPIVNDATVDDALQCGLDKAGLIIENGDYIQGTMISRSCEKLRQAFGSADVVIAKGQANLECLSDEQRPVYFLLMAKCDFIAGWLGVPRMSTLCVRGGGKR